MVSRTAKPSQTIKLYRLQWQLHVERKDQVFCITSNLFPPVYKNQTAPANHSTSNSVKTQLNKPSMRSCSPKLTRRERTKKNSSR